MKKHSVKNRPEVSLITGLVLMCSALSAYAADDFAFPVSGRILPAACSIEKSGDFIFDVITVPGSSLFLQGAVINEKTIKVSMECSSALMATVAFSNTGSTNVGGGLGADYWIGDVKADGGLVGYTYSRDSGSLVYADSNADNLIADSATGSALLYFNRDASAHTLSTNVDFDLSVQLIKNQSGALALYTFSDTLTIEVNYI